jgi:hypothetical protein
MSPNTNHCALSMDETVDRVNLMRHQEGTSYCYRNYFLADLDEKDVRLNVTWREKICQWSYNVVDQ